MSKDVFDAISAVFVAVIGVAILAVLVSSRSQTPAVLQSLGSAFSNALGVAVSPVTGATVAPNLAYPGSGAFQSPLSFSGAVGGLHF